MKDVNVDLEFASVKWFKRMEKMKGNRFFKLWG